MDQGNINPHSKQGNWQERQSLWTLENDNHEIDVKCLFPEIIFKSKVMEQVLVTIYKVAKSHSSVLIQGESGTGKELVASAIHRLSPRAKKAFVAINCSAIPENLLESELFGHEKGAFTGADRKRIGHFAAANYGSAFLDEIGDMPIRLQAKLLRVLQERKFTPVGGRETVDADIRVIAATNIDLEQAVRQQEFRLDLYYRLNVLPLHIPPLRERREDIAILLDHFVEHSNRMHPHNQPGWIDDDAKQLLHDYDWPGNIRQLQNLVERLIIINGGGRLGKAALPKEFIHEDGFRLNHRGQEDIAPAENQVISGFETKAPPVELDHKQSYPADYDKDANSFPGLSTLGFCLSTHIADLENKYIVQALKTTQNNKNQAAKLLGINRTTLVERIKKRNIKL